MTARSEYPQILPHLTISLPKLFDHPSLNSIFGTSAKGLDFGSSTGPPPVNFVADSCECVVVLRSGAVIVYRFAEAGTHPPIIRRAASNLQAEASDDVIPLGYLWDESVDGFKPICLLNAKHGAVSSCAMSKIGQ